MAQLAQALQADAQGQPAQATQARADALEQAPASSGRLNGVAFEWIADADSRLGPVLEVIINGRYGWLPFVQLCALTIEPVADLRDLVWAPAHLSLRQRRRYGGPATGALCRQRDSGDAALQMARTHRLAELWPNDQYSGLGQRVLATDVGETGLLGVRADRFRCRRRPPEADAAAP